MGSDSSVSSAPAGARGVVVELLPAAQFRVEMSGGRQVVAHMAAATKRDFVRLRVRDEVLVELTANDPSRGRITRVLRRER